MRRVIGISLFLTLLTGCEPSVPPEDLGTILEEAPEIPGTDEPYEMPELDRPAAEEKSSSQSGPIPDPEHPLPDTSTDEGGLHR